MQLSNLFRLSLFFIGTLILWKKVQFVTGLIIYDNILL